jgi:hypothetical protein
MSISRGAKLDDRSGPGRSIELNTQFVCADGHWKGFIAEQNKKYPELPDDLAATICTLDAIWIVQQSSDFQFCRKYNIRVRGEL